MNRLVPIVAVAAAFLATGSFLLNRVQAAPLGAAIPLAQDEMNPIERVALCFYPNGWAGPGLYQCGYRLRYGEGFYERREREERRERFEDRREGRERFEDRREGRERFEDRREGRERFQDRERGRRY